MSVEWQQVMKQLNKNNVVAVGTIVNAAGAVLCAIVKAAGQGCVPLLMLKVQDWLLLLLLQVQGWVPLLIVLFINFYTLIKKDGETEWLTEKNERSMKLIKHPVHPQRLCWVTNKHLPPFM